jgi:hypothetical protein
MRRESEACGSLARASGERGKHIASRRSFRLISGMTIGNVDKATLGIDVAQRMKQRELPSGKQRENQNDPRETGQQASWPGRRR